MDGSKRQVALLAEGVDRNGYEVNIAKLEQVALLAEGVDRNIEDPAEREELVVALLAEGVDRNWSPGLCSCWNQRSPSSRRAWIEISLCGERRERLPRRPPRGGRG